MSNSINKLSFGYGELWRKKPNEEEYKKIKNLTPELEEKILTELIDNQVGDKCDFIYEPGKTFEGKNVFQEQTPGILLKNNQLLNIYCSVDYGQMNLHAMYTKKNARGDFSIIRLIDEGKNKPHLQVLYKKLLTTFLKTNKH